MNDRCIYPPARISPFVTTLFLASQQGLITYGYRYRTEKGYVSSLDASIIEARNRDPL